LGILELLKYHPRILYIDIDVHHGDGVEEAFFTTDRVMTVSFHKYGDFFPGTGDYKDIGAKKGKNYAVNFPMEAGIDDKSYQLAFEPVIQRVMDVYQPTAIVLQCGADSITGDRLGCFNLTLKGHGNCVQFVKSFNVPMLVVGGGGYNIRNVSRCWAHETGLLLDEQLSDNIPYNDFFEYYGPEFKLHLNPNPSMVNENSREYLENVKMKVFEHLRNIEHAPSVQMHQVPPDMYLLEDMEEDNPDVRFSQKEQDKYVQPDNEFYADDKDQDRTDYETTMDVETAKSSSSTTPASQSQLTVKEESKESKPTNQSNSKPS